MDGCQILRSTEATASRGMADDEAPTVHSYEGARNQLGQRHGTGTSTFPNGDKFEGEPPPAPRTEPERKNSFF